MSVLHRQSNKTIRLSQPQQFLATERTIVEDAYPGDIIGVFDAGTMGVGDTLCAVSYTHLDVYKRQIFNNFINCIFLVICSNTELR